PRSVSVSRSCGATPCSPTPAGADLVDDEMLSAQPKARAPARSSSGTAITSKAKISLASSSDGGVGVDRGDSHISTSLPANLTLSPLPPGLPPAHSGSTSVAHVATGDDAATTQSATAGTTSSSNSHAGHGVTASSSSSGSGFDRQRAMHM